MKPLFGNPEGRNPGLIAASDTTAFPGANASRSFPPLPGTISGIGGGTWNLDGTQATPMQRNGFDVSLDGGPSLPAALPPMPSSSASQGRGLFGRGRPAPLPTSVSRSAPTNGFDYDAARGLLAPQDQKKKGLLGILEVLGPALMAAGGDSQGANAYVARQLALRDDGRRRQLDAQAQIAKWQHDDWAAKYAADLRASAPFTIGRERLQFDPESGDVSSLYKGNAEFEDYAASQGLEPGTDEYFNAVEDYVLRGNGPSAMAYDQRLDDYRTGNRLKVVGAQQKGRERVRSMPTYRDLHPAPTRTAAPRTSRGASRPTATGPNGQKVEWDGKAWVPVR